MHKLGIDADTWAELDHLLDDGLDQPVAQREQWLASLAPQFDSLKPHLRRLLSRAAQIETDEFLSTLPNVGCDADLETIANQPTGAAGDTIGPYRLVRELGTGGMGTVWLAQRSDGLIDRPVALKLPHGIWRRAGLAERMAREREILATLNHPHIARLYDAGVAADGQPYLALEYVQGRPIDEYCRDTKVDLKARLRLFSQVAQAMAYAHGKLIIHRDLKPANILVTAEGQVRLLDFGIAKLTEEGQAKETSLTQLSGRALTPDYASPEQIVGEPLTVASDVYSLGVVLYELLAESRPYKLKRDSRGALEDAILLMQPGAPSAVAATAWYKALRGDLDTIVLKALKKKPTERYATVHALLEDIERYLTARPVLAQPDSAWYRLNRFIVRNALAVAATASVFIAILAGAGIAVVQMREANAQRDAAVYQQQRAAASAEFMNLLLEGIGPQGQALTLTELLARGTQMLDAQYGVDEALAARMLYEVSFLYEVLGKAHERQALLDRSIRSAGQLGDIDLLIAARCAAVSGLLDSDPARAREMMRLSATLLERSAVPSIETQVICQRARAQLARLDGNIDAAILHLQDGLRILDDSAVHAAPMRTMLLTQLIDNYSANGRNADALDLTAQVLEIYKRSGRGTTMRNIIAMMNHGVTLYRSGEILSAAAIHEEALAIVRRSDPTGRPPPGLQAYSIVQLRLGRYEDALASNEVAQKRAREEGDVRFLAPGELVAARALAGLKQFTASEQHVQAAEKVWQVDPVANQRALNEVMLVRIETLLAQQQYEHAHTLGKDLLEKIDYPSKQRGHAFGWALLFVARAHMGLGDAPTAAHFASEAEQVFASEARDPRFSANVGMAQLTRAQALETIGDLPQAKTVTALAHEALKTGFGEQHAETMQAADLVARLMK